MSEDILDRNERAWRVADARGGLAGVFNAAVSETGCSALRHAAHGIMAGMRGEVGLDRRLLAKGRVDAFMCVLRGMRDAGVSAFDRGWTAAPVSLDKGVLPVRAPGEKGAGGDTACRVVSRLLGELPVNDGLTALTVVVEAGNLPEPVPINDRLDPLLPTSVAVVGPGSPLYHAGLFAVEARLDSGVRMGLLPGLPTDLQGPMLPIALYNLLNREPGSAGGRGVAELHLRIFVEGLCSVMRRNWRSAERFPVSVSTTLRDFLRWFYPGRTPRPNEYWPRLMAASAALDRPEARILYRDLESGRSGLRRVVSFGDIPTRPRALDDEVSLVVHLPPGSTSGPQINRGRLRYWGAKSAPAYRALLALAYQWFRPGVTRVPGPGGNGWVQSQDPSAYEPYSRGQVVELCFPMSIKANRRELAARAWRVVRTLEATGDVRVVGQRILPPLEDLAVKVM